MIETLNHLRIFPVRYDSITLGGSKGDKDFLDLLVLVGDHLVPSLFGVHAVKFISP